MWQGSPGRKEIKGHCSMGELNLLLRQTLQAFFFFFIRARFSVAIWFKVRFLFRVRVIVKSWVEVTNLF